MIAVDASIALAWALQEREHADAAAALAYVTEHGAYVPGNFHSEIAHALLQAERRRRLSETDVTEALSALLALPLTVELPDPHVIASVARAHGLTCYDASYLALALQAQLPLATVDAGLTAAARAAKCLWKPRS
ncbi:MAG: type II toxin-antitoxin system VapC family toxin [Candidatus Tyrphobacter sp.]